ncbi:MAG: hypothetical protein ACTSQF_07960 [Candidatus Heimdallarchaeaceae archaeon]
MKGTIIGITSMEMDGVGTLSTGPEYYIQPTDDYKKKWDKIHVRKQTQSWEEDLNLHNLVSKEVEILADIIETRTTISIDYLEVKEKK